MNGARCTTTGDGLPRLAPRFLVLGPWSRVLVALFSLGIRLGMGETAIASPENIAPRPSPDSARTLAPDTGEVGLISPLRYGAYEGIELSTRVFGALLLPQASAKFHLFGGDPRAQRWSFASRNTLSYPTWFFERIAKEGAGGLLPANTDVPLIVSLRSELMTGRGMGASHELSLSIAAELAPRFTDGRLPLLDFPLLYPRFAASHSTATADIGGAVFGSVWGPIRYHTDLRYYYLPLDTADIAFDGGYAIEQSTTLTWDINSTWSTSVSYLWTHALYPIGTRTHSLPYADVIYRF